VALDLRRVRGPARVTLAEDEAVAICLVKDGAYFLPAFLAHHFRIGVRHVVLVDNGSTDGTLDIAAAHDRVTVLRSRLPAADYENQLRARAAATAAKGGWRLFIDVDELFDWPFSDRVPLRDLLRRANARGATAVAAQMLDLFPEGDLMQARGLDFAAAIDAFRCYDLSSVERRPYHDPGIKFAGRLKNNVVSNPGIDVLFGGVRKAAFGEHPCLTKHPLVRPVEGVEPAAHPHCSSHARVADFTTLIRHYKFAGDFVARDRRQVAAGVWRHGEDRLRMEAVARRSSLNLAGPATRRLEKPEQLVDEGFLVSPSGEDLDAEGVRRMARAD
jgi:hypothetical protein